MGETVVIDQELGGDVLIAGNTLQITAAIYGDVLIAGMDIDTSASVMEDARLAGFRIDVNAPVGGNLTTASQRSEHLVAAASIMSLYGTVGGNTELEV